MISQKNNRVQAIKSKFENLNHEKDQLLVRKSSKQLSKQHINQNYRKSDDNQVFVNDININESNAALTESTFINLSPTPNSSYLYSKTDGKQNEARKTLTRQSSDPGKKLHRSHAFRCDRSQKINNGPKRHGSCNGRSESSDFSVKMGDRKLSRERLKMLGNFIEGQMKKENFVLPLAKIVGVVADLSPASISDKDVPQHILDQYATVVKTKKKDEKQEAMTDSGVSSETENLEDEKNAKIKKLMSKFEKTEPETDSNLEEMNDLCASSETMRLERKNPHLILTATLKKALKQPLPAGPPPKKPPRSFASPTPESPENQKKDTKKMLEKLEQVLQKRESQKEPERIYDVAETDLSVKKSKEMHYLCTEILDITQRTLLPNQCNDVSHSLAVCFNSLNCAVLTNSTASLPYTRLSSRPNSNIEATCSCSDNSLDSNSKRFSTFLSNSQEKCTDCKENDEKPGFKSHLNCYCGTNDKSKVFVKPEPIYDEPYFEGNQNSRRSQYGTLNSLKTNGYSKSLEDLRSKVNEEEKIYDIPYAVSSPPTPEFSTSSPKSDFQKLREAFESGNPKTDTENDTNDFGSNKKIGIIKQKSMEGTEKRKFGTEIYDNKKIGTITEGKRSIEKPPLTPKPNMYVKKFSKSTENLIDETTPKKAEKRFNTETKRYRNRTDTNTSIKRNTQLDLDRENLNRLMDEIYDTVTAACNMENKKPSSFPTDQSDGSISEESVKLTRSLTETRKNYVRRVSSRVARLDQNNLKRVQRFRHQTSVCSYKSEIVDNPYSTFRSWKSFRASRTNLNKSNMNDNTYSNLDSSDSIASLDDLDSESIGAQSIDEKTACVDIQLPFEVRERGLFNVCLLVGLNYLAGQAYVKSVFPSQVKLPPHIENLIFPETLNEASKREWIADASSGQCYSLVLTDDKGERSYGYCRRVLPEGASTCLPLCYCLIGKYRAPGFYYKVLQEIESHHGSSEVQRNSVLQQLFEMDFPNPGEELTITYKINSSVANIASCDEKSKSKTMPDCRRNNIFEPCSDSNALANGSNKLANGSNEVDSSIRPGHGSVFYDNFGEYEEPRYMDLENNNGPKQVMLSLQNVRTKILKRPIEPRVDEDNLSTLLDSFGAGLVLKVFGSLLLERKVVIVSDKLSVVSSCMEALQSALYPFVWQQPLIATIPEDIQDDMLEAPLPMLAGMLKTSALDNVSGITFEENGMLIDLTNPSKVLFYKGDESTILPTSSYKALKTSLQMESNKHKDRTDDIKTRNLMISEAFLRFLIEILGDFWKYFSVGEVKEGSFGKNNVIFDKELYIKNAQSKQIQFFLEWFTETAMFNHFIQNMCLRYSPEKTQGYNLVKHADNLVDTPLPDFYELLDDRMLSRQDSVTKNVEKSNYKNAVNKKMKILKTKLRDLIN